MVRQILGISGGKDSAALAIYLKNKYPELNGKSTQSSPLNSQ